MISISHPTHVAKHLISSSVSDLMTEGSAKGHISILSLGNFPNFTGICIDIKPDAERRTPIKVLLLNGEYFVKWSFLSVLPTTVWNYFNVNVFNEVLGEFDGWNFSFFFFFFFFIFIVLSHLFLGILLKISFWKFLIFETYWSKLKLKSFLFLLFFL